MRSRATSYDVGADGERRLGAYFDMLGGLLGHELRRASFAAYATGLPSEGDRESMEPIAARLPCDPVHAGAGHHGLRHSFADADVTFKTKPELALAMIERAARAGILGDILHVLDAQGNRTPKRSAKEIALGLSAEDLRSCSWREGTYGTLRSRFAFVVSI